jgi:hypothetical protein
LFVGLFLGRGYLFLGILSFSPVCLVVFVFGPAFFP